MPKIDINCPKIGYRSETKPVLSDVQLNLRGGNIYALVGANGAGKSTLINTMIGVLQPISGAISLDLDHLQTPVFSKIGFCHQFPLVDWFTRVSDNVILGPLLSGKGLKESKEKTNFFLKLLGIYDLRNRAMDHISGGQQQRVQLARELSKAPDIYLLDEPTTGLDVETSEKLFQFLKTRAAEGKLVLISSHDLTLIEEYSNKIIFIDEGKIKFKGEMDKFVNSNGPQNDIKITTSGNGFKAKTLTELEHAHQLSNHIITIQKSALLNTINVLAKNNEVIAKIETIQPSLREQYLTIMKKNGRKNESKQL
ncbi:ABC transporter ATP-binding protein [Fructilactobacillus ixorae]|uniref:ABC transporter ATP-binding protein n=1 Tax=Fructilactobacillus ixorae TaxID=1750535 RepID=A0ABY5C5Q6_9LACO|nr:ABC transporter ATP-binding protein [Fructilactobacillus ixorae]USS93776.1 ABC transporter ATP-binding protein [Fructilactobacillus ixorae]